MAVTRFLGVDLAWREGRDDLPANETGVAVLDPAGRILDAGWTRGVPDTLGWADAAAGGRYAVMFVDASLVVTNPAGQRRCETQVGQRYGAWKVSAHSTNLRSPRLAGVRLLSLAGQAGWRYSDGRAGRLRSGRVISEASRTARWSARRNSATTGSGHGTSASRGGCRWPNGGRGGRPPATS